MGEGLLSISIFIEHISNKHFGTDLSDDLSSEAMMNTFVNLQAEVKTKGISRKRVEFAEFFYAERFKDSLEEIYSPWFTVFRTVL